MLFLISSKRGTVAAVAWVKAIAEFLRTYVFSRRPICVFHPITCGRSLLHPRAMTKAAPLKLLIVDDHAAMRGTLRLIFEGQLVTLVEAATGEEAIRLFTAERPDWVIMDVRMPGMGGIKATKAIRQLDRTARIVLISQFAESEHHDLALQAGAVEFVDKEHLSTLPRIIQR